MRRAQREIEKNSDQWKCPAIIAQLDSYGSDLRSCTAVKSVAIFLAAVAAAISAQADLLLPTATGTTWKYQMVQEFGNLVG